MNLLNQPSHLGQIIPDSTATLESVEEGLAKAKLIYLTSIETKLRWPSDGELSECSAFEVDLAISLYREFLALIYAYPEKKIVPIRIIDAVWHAHILDTKAYARDCDRMFGKFLHHYPYFGMGGPEDEKRLEAAYSETCELWVQHFQRRPDFYTSFDNSYRCANNCSSCKG